jgi:nicotinamidase-related amidase
MLNSSDVPISQSALLVIDVQQSFFAGDRWPLRGNLDFEKNVVTLVDLYRAAKLPVFFIMHTDPDPGFRTNDPQFKLMEFLKPVASEPLLIKNTRNAFTSTTLQADLIHRGVRKVVITGIQTEQCCETTARVAADLGYAVDFVSEATQTFPIPNHDKPGEELGTDAIRERTEYALRRRFARIATVNDIAQDLRAAGLLARGTVLA